MGLAGIEKKKPDKIKLASRRQEITQQKRWNALFYQY